MRFAVFAALLAALALSADASAQGGLVATPSPYADSLDVPLVVWNPTADAVPFDSLSFAWTPDGEGTEDLTRLVSVDGLPGVPYTIAVECLPPRFRGACFENEAFGAVLAPGDSLRLGVFLSCGFCRGRSATPDIEPGRDTLLVYSGGDPAPLRVPLAITEGYAGNAEAPPAGGAPSVWPNPARSTLTVAYGPSVAVEAREVRVVDVRGRDVLAPVGVGPGGGSAALDVSGLAPGVYVVRVGAGAARFVVVR